MCTTKPFALTALALASLAPVASAQFGGWGPATQVTWQSFQVKSIRLADMNNDGMLDIVVLSQSSSSPSHAFAVVAGNGAGAFHLPVFISTTGGTAQQAFVVFDIDVDSLPDVVVLESVGVESRVALYRNLGDMAFSEPIRTIVGEWINTADMAACDIDGDGDLDIVVSGYQYTNLWLLLNDGVGDLHPLKSVAMSQARNVAVGDLNGDGNDDIVTSLGASYSVLLNDGTGDFGAAYSSVTPDMLEGIALFDADGDGDLDLAGSYGAGAGSRLLVDRNNGAGQFGARSIVSSGTGGNVAHRPGAVAAADLDGDGDQDLLVVGGLGRLVVHFNEGNGLFGSPLSVTTSSSAKMLAVADFDGNSSPDVVTASIGGEPLHIRLNQTDILPPGSFDLLTPADGAAGLPLPGEPSWSGPNGALTWQPASGFTVSYRAQIATDPDFKNIVFESPYGAALQATTPPGLLATMTRYYWRVIAETAAGETASTSVFTFVTRLQGDTDADGDVDFADLNNLLNNYGASSH